MGNQMPRSPHPYSTTYSTNNSNDNDRHFFMLTYDPGLKHFQYVESHAVFTNNQMKTVEIPAPLPPSCEVQFSAVASPHNINDELSTTKVTALVKHLIQIYASVHELKDVDKVKALYIWLASQQIHKALYRTTPDFETVAFQLQKLQDKKNTYAALFCLMCNYAGIPCVIIKGYVKGSKYEIGEQMCKKHQREWNAVLVDGEWRFVDVLWGAQSCHGEFPDPYYLFPEPEELIFSHYPEIQQWQLIKSPISKSQFEQQAYIKQRFFSMKMEILTNANCHIEATKGEVEILFQLDPANAENQQFNCVTKRYRDSNWFIEEPVQKNVQLDFVHKMRNEGDDNEKDELQNSTTVTAVSVKVRFPQAGDYKLEIIGRNQEAGDDVNFDWVAIYKIKVKTVPDWPVFFPRTDDIGWGPNPYLRQCGLNSASHHNGNIKCHPGSLEIKFTILPTAPTQNIKLHYMIKEIGDDEENDANRDDVMGDFKKDGNMLIGTVFLDQPPDHKATEQKFMLFATLNTTDKGNVCNYLITCEEDKSKLIEEMIIKTIGELKDAIELCQLAKLKRATYLARQSGLHANKRVKPVYRKADDLRRKLQSYEDSLKRIRKVDANTILTLNRYHKQPEDQIENVMKATFAILGSPDHVLSSWDLMKQEITTISGRQRKSLTARIQRLDTKQLTKATVEKAKSFLEGIEVNMMVGKSADVASFAIWVKSVIEAYDNRRAIN